MVDTEGNSNTQMVSYDENEIPYVTGYTIDTTNNPNGGEVLNGDGVNTEFVPFDGSGDGFICHIEFKSRKLQQPNPPTVVDTEDSSANYLFNILNAKSPFSPWPGFYLRWILKKTNYSTGEMKFGITGAGATSTTSRSIPLPSTGADGIYNIDIIYDPNGVLSNTKLKLCINHVSGGATYNYNVTFDTNNIDFTIGYALNQQGDPYRYAYCEVLAFSVQRIS